MLVERLDTLESPRETVSRARNHVSNPPPRVEYMGYYRVAVTWKCLDIPESVTFTNRVRDSLSLPLTSQMCQTRMKRFAILFAGKTGTMNMGIQQHYPRTQPANEDSNYASLPAELSSFTSSTFEPCQDKIPEPGSSSKRNSSAESQQQQHRRPRPNESLRELAGNRRKIGSTDVFGQNMENLVQLEDPASNWKRQITKDEIREESFRRHAKSVLGLESLIVGLENGLHQEHYPRNLLRRNQSFDHARYPPLSYRWTLRASKVHLSAYTFTFTGAEWKVRRQVSYKLFKMRVSTCIIHMARPTFTSQAAFLSSFLICKINIRIHSSTYVWLILYHLHYLIYVVPNIFYKYNKYATRICIKGLIDIINSTKNLWFLGTFLKNIKN